MIPRNQLIHNLQLAQQRLKTAKAIELRWRMLVALELFPDPKIGTNTNGTVKMVAKENISVVDDKELIGEMFNALYRFKPDDYTKLLNWKATLNKAEYDGLSDDAKLIVSSILTIKPGLPTVSVGNESDEAE